MISHKTISLSIKIQKAGKLNLQKEPIHYNAHSISWMGLAHTGWDIQPLETKESLAYEVSGMTGPEITLEEDFIPF